MKALVSFVQIVKARQKQGTEKGFHALFKLSQMQLENVISREEIHTVQRQCRSHSALCIMYPKYVHDCGQRMECNTLMLLECMHLICCVIP